MDFGFSKDQRELKEMARNFVDRKLAPLAAGHDRKQNPKDCIPLPILKEAVKVGIGGAAVPKEFGGYELSNIEIMIMMEELARGDAGFAYTILSMLTGAGLLARFGTNEQKHTWLPMIADDKKARARAEPKSVTIRQSPISCPIC